LEADLAGGLIVAKPLDNAVRAGFTAVVEQCHAMRPPIYIRTNDAIHLAAARCAGETEVVATDKRLREAALALGFAVFPPP
jgi:predicted nucleic acid-binding protein